MSTVKKQKQPTIGDYMRASVMLGYAHSRSIAAMQAAWIEWKHGRGADAGMQWIENTLWGPGLIPGEDGKPIGSAQAFFDAALEEIEERRKQAEADAAAHSAPAGEPEVCGNTNAAVADLLRRFIVDVAYTAVLKAAWPEGATEPDQAVIGRRREIAEEVAEYALEIEPPESLRNLLAAIRAPSGEGVGVHAEATALLEDDDLPSSGVWQSGYRTGVLALRDRVAARQNEGGAA